MQVFRIKAILALSILSTLLSIYIWIQNANRINVAPTLNNLLKKEMIIQIQKSENIDSLKIDAVNIIHKVEKNQIHDSKKAIKESILLFLLIIFSITTNILIIKELIKHKNK